MRTPRELLEQSHASLTSGATVRAAQEARQALALARGDEALERQGLTALGAALWARGELHEAALALGAAHRLGELDGDAGLTALDELARSVPGWEQGRRLSPQAVQARLVDEQSRVVSGWASLTLAERQVVELAIEGLTNPAIARALFLSPNTVKTHLLRSYRKLGITSRTELARSRP